MTIKIIKNEQEYDRALERLNEILDAEEGTPEYHELELLALVIDEYEQKHHPIDPPDPIEET